nr:MAG TPA: hypothetical protein [Caudoviricetes sp.]
MFSHAHMNSFQKSPLAKSTGNRRTGTEETA